MRAVPALALAGLALACATLEPAPRFRFFGQVPADDAWSARVHAWQTARRIEARSDPPPVATQPLAASFGTFAGSLRLEIAQRTLAWAQSQSGLYYRDDPGAEHWPTLGELLRTGHDDCDGLDLLVFETLRSLGFARGELYRAVIAERTSGQHHMVTLWFAAPGGDDPIVLDATAYVAPDPVPLSRLRGWEPVVLFDEFDQFRAAPASAPLGPRSGE